MNAIRKMREKAKISQLSLAQKVDVSQQAVANWETGQALPRADKLPKLAGILGCTVDELLKDEYGDRNAG